MKEKCNSSPKAIKVAQAREVGREQKYLPSSNNDREPEMIVSKQSPKIHSIALHKFLPALQAVSAKTNNFLLTPQCFPFFRRTGSLLATTSKDKSLRIIDPRNGEVLREGDCHRGTKASKVRLDENKCGWRLEHPRACSLNGGMVQRTVRWGSGADACRELAS